METELANVRSERGAAEDRERLVHAELAQVRETTQERERTLQERIAVLRADHAKALADLENARVERESTERRVKALEAEIAILRDSSLTRERELDAALAKALAAQATAEADLENLRAWRR